MRFFPNLRLLNISSNRLKTLKGVEKCPLLQEIYADNNEIDNLEGLSGLKNLTILKLAFNQFDNFEIFKELRGLSSLKRLDIQGNMVACTKTFRDNVLKNLPNGT